MSKIRFLADEDLRHQIIAAVRRLAPQIQFDTVVRKGWAHRPDGQVLQLAAAEGLAVVSHDVRTMTAAAYLRIERSEEMAGLFVTAQTYPIRTLAEVLVLLWEASEAEEWFGRVTYLPI